MRIALLLVGLVLVAGCNSTELGDRVAQESARSVITPVVEDRFPGANASEITDCIIDDATAGEIIDLAQAAAFGVTDRTIHTVSEIALRRDAVVCIAESQLAGLVL
jgi:hypothetical protein